MNKLLTLNILILLLVSCVNKEKSESEFYAENKTSFFDLRNSDWTKNTWIRKPENLKTIHESFKKFGYDKLENLIFKSNNEFLIQDICIKRNFENLMDSLQLTYNKPEKQTKYYAEFWNRRKAENNDSIVYEIIREFNSVKSDKKRLNYDNEFVNDTLVDLLKIEFNNKNLTSEKAKSDFDILKKYGLHQSAYNLLYERPEYFDTDLDRKKMEKELTKTKEFKEAWLIDNAK
ncbi:hypothetical protein JJL45_11690 [Tamlana sp. s12]|uniref:hypothetical protein n=1 Tax=Tamlana sp. s12 TaxID=1630406 RepID=UPI0007FEF6A5|nr:hypothetical protein [Tamlana sp. s12]OBQ46166.1 hypothetical protein VQ01_15675 [Tamlana sp. s12]QQY81584.1 hypothetical protein JJL45_11690 [Tamlana sp. s12]